MRMRELLIFAAAALYPWTGGPGAEEAPVVAESSPEPLDDSPQTTASADAEPDSLLPFKERIASTNLANASDKVGFSGFLVNRAFNHRYDEFPAWLGTDAAGTFMDAELTLKVNVNAYSFMKVWSMLTFGYGFQGHDLNERSWKHPRWVTTPSGASGLDTVFSDKKRFPTNQDKQREGLGVFEDMMAGMEIRTEPVDAYLRAGSALWLEGSPFTIWKRDPRQRLAWYYESYEPELSSAQYYNQKFFYRRNDQGRSTWPKKPFGGIEIDAYKMPFGLGLQFDVAQPSNILPTNTDGNTNSHLGDAEALGSINSIGDLYYGRLTRQKVFRDITLGGNLLWVQLPEDIINQRVFSPNPVQGFRYQFRGGRQPFFTNSRVFSLDARGNFSPTLFIQADIALAMEDSVKYLRVQDPSQPDVTIYDGRSGTERASSAMAPAAYLKLNNTGSHPSETELFFASRNFWSPYAMTEYAVPVRKDEMKLGVGSFSYQSNLTGINFKASPKVTNGFLAVTLGKHVQVGKGKDILRFQHNLTGRDLWYASGSWSRTDPRRMLDEGLPFGNPKYQARIGDLGPDRNLVHAGHQPGGLRGDDLELWEEFAAYESVEQANAGIVPRHQKFSTTLAVDWGRNINQWFGLDRTILVALYGAFSSITTDALGILNSDKTLLWSGLARLEPGIALSPSFHVIGLVGAETWKSEKSYRNALYNKTSAITPTYNNINYYEPISSLDINSQNAVPRVVAVHSPIEYLQMAYGLGFDWDFSERAGVHVRFKYATHDDEHLPSNNWQGTFLFAETKIWF